MESFLLYLYLPTRARSYLLGSKNSDSMSIFALSTVGGSPGRRRRYISMRPSSTLCAAVLFERCLQKVLVAKEVDYLLVGSAAHRAHQHGHAAVFCVLSTRTQ